MSTRRRRAFTLRDLCFGLATLGLAAAIVLAATTGVRKRAQLAAAQNQLRWIAGVTSSYAADFEDRMWGLSWEAGEPYAFRGGTWVAPTGLIAAAAQATDILDRRAGRTDIPVPFSWYAPAAYSHLPLLDYLERDGPDPAFVSPGDKHRLNWTKDPRELHDKGFWLPYQESPTPETKRWPYSSSFQAPPAIISAPAVGPDAVRQADTHGRYTAPSATTFQGCELASIAFPAQKVLLHESSSWYTGVEFRYFADPRASVNVLTADGSARLLSTAGANRGWRPEFPTSANPTLFIYEPRVWEGPLLPIGERRLSGQYRYTRGALAGRDFGGPEIDTGQP
jgi:type II secretory pathway pseudopilin PulG